MSISTAQIRRNLYFFTRVCSRLSGADARGAAAGGRAHGTCMRHVPFLTSCGCVRADARRTPTVFQTLDCATCERNDGNESRPSPPGYAFSLTRDGKSRASPLVLLPKVRKRSCHRVQCTRGPPLLKLERRHAVARGTNQCAVGGSEAKRALVGDARAGATSDGRHAGCEPVGSE